MASRTLPSTAWDLASAWWIPWTKSFAEPIDPKIHLDAVEAKLFGIGVESYTPGSAEFYMGYAASRGKLLTPRRRATTIPPR